MGFDKSEIELDQEIARVMGRISELQAKRNAESTQGPIKGFAIIGRYRLNNGSPEGIEKVRLSDGDGVVFLKGGGLKRFRGRHGRNAGPIQP